MARELEKEMGSREEQGQMQTKEKECLALESKAEQLFFQARTLRLTRIPVRKASSNGYCPS